MTVIWKKSICLITLLLAATLVRAQSNPPKQETTLSEKGPKLVVGIVVDQMRYDYLPLYWDKFGDGGFKRLVQQGYSFANNHYNYFPTYTGPGHASIYTGTTPSVHGIIGNDWYDRSLGRNVYCVSDSSVSTVGTNSEAGKMSPDNLWSTTVTDQLKLASPESKVIAMSIKDRAAILPGGHLADGAYWYDGQSGNFISSSWYRDKLPRWVQSFNKAGLARELSNKSWQTLLPMDQYTESHTDNSPYEGSFGKEDAPVFPHKLSDYTQDSFNIIKSSPFGNDLLEAFAKKAIDGESLGVDEITDFLAVSFSSTDYVGHQFGPHSVELEDTYLRLDRSLADLFDYLDKKVGKGNYLVMLTADHGVVDVPAEMMDEGLPGGYFNSDEAMAGLSDYLNAAYGDGKWVESYINQQVYLNREMIEEQDLKLSEVQKDAADFLRGLDGVQSTNTATNFEYRDYSHGLQGNYQNGFHYDRSGDVYIELKPGWLDSSYRTGTSHGSPYNYDTHVPLLFYGWNIPHGKTSQKTVITQLAPTISAMLNIDYPSGSKAEVLEFED